MYIDQDSNSRFSIMDIDDIDTKALRLCFKFFLDNSIRRDQDSTEEHRRICKLDYQLYNLQAGLKKTEFIPQEDPRLKHFIKTE